MDNYLLSGVRVLDVGSFVAGPAAATVMSDFGAEVIKIEPPGIGDTYRYLPSVNMMPACDLNYCWMLTSRNKKSLALDLKADAAKEVINRLIKSADVFLTNLPVDVIARLGITYCEVSAINDRIIFAHLTGYGEAGPDAAKPGYDATAWWARSGMMDHVRDGNGQRGMPAPGMGDHPTAMSVFGAIMAGLYQREKTGKGTKVSSSLIANGAWSNSVFIQCVLAGGEAYEPLPRALAGNALVNQYRTSDDRWFLVTVINEAKDAQNLTKAIGQPELLDDPRFATSDDRKKNARQLIGILDAAFSERSWQEWQPILTAHRITFSPVNRLVDIPVDEQMQAADVLLEMDVPGKGKVRTINSPIWIEGQTKVTPQMAPEIGEHSDEILCSVGYSAAEVAQLRADAVVGG